MPPNLTTCVKAILNREKLYAEEEASTIHPLAALSVGTVCIRAHTNRRRMGVEHARLWDFLLRDLSLWGRCTYGLTQTEGRMGVEHARLRDFLLRDLSLWARCTYGLTQTEGGWVSNTPACGTFCSVISLSADGVHKGSHKQKEGWVSNTPACGTFCSVISLCADGVHKGSHKQKEGWVSNTPACGTFLADKV